MRAVYCRSSSEAALCGDAIETPPLPARCGSADSFEPHRVVPLRPGRFLAKSTPKKLIQTEACARMNA